jgi:predicted neuraminidase
LEIKVRKEEVDNTDSNRVNKGKNLGCASYHWHMLARILLRSGLKRRACAVLLLLCLASVGVDMTWRAANLGAGSLAQAALPLAETVLGAGSSVPATTAISSPERSVKSASTRLVETAQGTIPMPANTPAAHASSLLAMPAASAAQMLAFWFAGERESAPNVQIAFSWFDRSKQAWMPARFVVNRFDLGAKLGFGIRRLGNPVAWQDADGRIHLFVVATGLGGWAAGRIAHLQQAGDAAGLSAQKPQDYVFEPVRVLPLSWLWNISYLVRAAPMPLADGGMLLPVYFEIGIKYPAVLRFGPRGEFVGLTRMSMRGDTLQPSIVPLSADVWLGFMRDHSAAHRVPVAQTRDAGRTWRDAPDLALANPGSSLAALRLPDGRLVMALNSLPNSRRYIDLALSVDGLAWETAVAMERADKIQDEFSYPAMAWDGEQLWVSYTDQRRSIKWRRYALRTQDQGK